MTDLDWHDKTGEALSNVLQGFINYVRSQDNPYVDLGQYAASFLQSIGHEFKPSDSTGTEELSRDTQDKQPTIPIEPYTLHVVNNEIVVYLQPIVDVPIFEDHCGSQAATVGVDLTDHANWTRWDDFPLALCWNVLKQCHEIHNPDRLVPLTDVTDGYIPFDHATGQLRAVLSLLKFAQDKLYGHKYFETTLPKVSVKQATDIDQVSS